MVRAPNTPFAVDRGTGFGSTYSRIVVSRDGMTLTEVQKRLDNGGEQTGETTLVYERIAP
jgi:hypothetical protein